MLLVGQLLAQISQAGAALVERRPLDKFLDFCLECAHMRLVLAQLDVPFFGLVYITWALLTLFACAAHLFVANRSASQKRMNHRIIKRRTYVNWFKNPTSRSVSTVVPSVLVTRSSAAEPEEGISSCAGIHLVWRCVSQLCLALAQRCAVCTVFFEKMSVFHTQRRQALRDRDGGRSRCLGCHVS